MRQTPILSSSKAGKAARALRAVCRRLSRLTSIIEQHPRADQVPRNATCRASLFEHSCLRPVAMTAEEPSEKAQVRLQGEFATQYDIEFRDLRFSVPSKKVGKPHTLILKGVSGYCRSARLTAIMGASGAGVPGLCLAFFQPGSHVYLLLMSCWASFGLTR